MFKVKEFNGALLYWNALSAKAAPDAVTVASADDLQAFTPKALLALYNTITAKPVTRYPTRGALNRKAFEALKVRVAELDPEPYIPDPQEEQMAPKTKKAKKTVKVAKTKEPKERLPRPLYIEPARKISEPRDGSKTAQVIAMLRKGVYLDTMAAHFEKSVTYTRNFLHYSVHKLHGHGVKGEVRDNGRLFLTLVDA